MRHLTNSPLTRLSETQLDDIAQSLDPTAETCDLRETLELWSEARHAPPRLPSGGYGPEDPQELAEQESLALYYTAQDIEYIFQNIAGQGLELAALANPSIDIKDYLRWSKHPRPRATWPRLCGERVFWRCNPKAASEEAIQVLIEAVNQQRTTGSSPLLERFCLDIGYTLVGHIDAESDDLDRFDALYKATYDVFDTLTPAEEDRELVIESGFASAIESRDVARWIEHLLNVQFKSGRVELECLAVVASAMTQVAEKIGLDHLPHFFDRIL